MAHIYWFHTHSLHKQIISPVFIPANNVSTSSAWNGPPRSGELSICTEKLKVSSNFCKKNNEASGIITVNNATDTFLHTKLQIQTRRHV